ncbi:aldo/keto reductase [Actinokineospora sp. G85]|uniref:aldo/keto reductase n=1 Tax=Actinokineospora sp. G85 TaxID=3406626 RepID=UPI003C74330B
MRTTAMGTTGLTVPVQGLGCMRMSDEAESATVINRALDLGVTFLDTADMYGVGRNEEIVGKAVRGRRAEALICTKFGVVFGDGDSWSIRGDPAYVRSSCDASLRRLGVETIDLFYLHRPDDTVPIEETAGAMGELVAAGKVRHIGLSEVSGEQLRAAHAAHPISAVQSEWSLCSDRVEEVVPVCAELGVGVVPYSPQGRGLLNMGRRAANSRFAQIYPKHGALPGLVHDVAAKHGAKPGQVALAWVQQRAQVWGVAVTPIPGTTSVPHLAENIAALDITLDAEDLALLDTRARPR